MIGNEIESDVDLLEELRKTTDNFNQESRCTGRDSSLAPPEQKQKRTARIQYKDHFSDV
jgi:hypothetical protein